MCVAGVFAYIGSSSAWIRVSFIQIRGLDYWFGFVTATSACAIVAASITDLRPHLVTPKWRKNLVIISLLSSIASITILLVIGVRVGEIRKEISRKAQLPDSFVGELILGVLSNVIGWTTTSIADFIEPKLAEGFYVTFGSFIIAALCSIIIVADNKPQSYNHFS